MKYVRWLKDAALADKSVVGYKAWSLSKLMENHVKVPKGFVVTSDAVEKLLLDVGLLDKVKNLCSVGSSSSDWRKVSLELQDLMLGISFTDSFSEDLEDYYQLLSAGESGGLAEGLVGGENPVVAIRLSSGFERVASDAKLSVSGANKVGDAVKSILSSYYNLRNCQKHLGEKFPAVLVQKMVFGKKSGSLFTKHPVTGDSSYVIESVFGLGTMLGGSTDISCDNYVIDPVGRSVLSREISEQNFADVFSNGSIVRSEIPAYMKNSQSLTDRECLEVGRQGQKIVSLLGNNMKVSFTCVGDSVFVLTALPMVNAEETGVQATVGEVVSNLGSNVSFAPEISKKLVVSDELSLGGKIEGVDIEEVDNDAVKLKELEESLESLDSLENSAFESAVFARKEASEPVANEPIEKSIVMLEREVVQKSLESSGSPKRSFEKLLEEKKEARVSGKDNKRKDIFFKHKKKRKGKFGKAFY